jgi:hypothetical protein
VTTTIIDPAAVLAAINDSLYRPEELDDNSDTPPDDAVVVPAIVATYAFNPTRLASHRQEVHDWLSLLPHGFRADEGGGWSFLLACDQEDGYRWTGEHRSMEALFALGIGLGMASWSLSRDLWHVLPGSMPYVSIRLS